MKVSVIIPVYNVEKYLRACLDSVVNQTLQDIEIICVDDGSTDSSPAILAEYAARDPRVKVITQPKSNAGAARNAGMAVASGEYLGFVDSDDWCELTLFEKAYAKAKAVGADLISWRFDQYSDATEEKSAVRVFPGQMISLGDVFSPEELGTLVFQPISYAPWGRMVKRSLVEGYDVRFQEIVRTNDVLFCCLVLAYARRQTYVNEVLYHYRIGRANNLQSGNAETPMLVVEVWSEIRSQLQCRGLIDKFGAHVALPSANSFFYTLHTIDVVASFRRFFKVLQEMYAPGGSFGFVEPNHFKANAQTLFSHETLRRSATAEEYLVRQLNYHRRQLADCWWSGQALRRDFERSKGVLAAMRAALAAERVEYETQLQKQERQNAELRKEVNELKQSESYRVGMFVLWPLRKLAAGFRWIRRG